MAKFTATKEFFEYEKINFSLDRDRLDCLSLLNLIKDKHLSKKSCTDNFQNVCEILLCEILNKPRTHIYLENPILDKEKLKKFSFYLNSVFSGIPLSFVLGKAFFFDFVFYLDEHCFIPRPETEILVEKTVEIAAALDKKSPLIYDICTGIGNIAISLTKSLTCCRIMATDISEKSLKFAYKNASLHKVGRKIKFICCDLTAGIKKGTEADIIVSNPPYIKSADICFLAENVKKEPHLALDGGCDGLDVIRRLFRNSEFYLKEGGFFIFEFGDNQAAAIEKIAADRGIFKDRQIIKDYNGKDRIFVGRKN
jgi:release factor glutamine methyltransferase